ncbi:leucyl/phenylalanyl-tRNA--protein transferase [Parasphingorhabdus sp.]|jgi:leucyl/phenylalanyl-tRNA--protein transferase|uniref:leucyl/phenylalanyl-tRNA--protein transferase n=1 Tax=Parasphingorhabdus sp. TaxID=2709688 RepID=UPI003D2D4729
MAINLDLLLKAYASGIFPMADARDDPETFWVEPKTRATIPLEGFRLSRSLRKTIISNRFRVTADTDFENVIRTCAEAAADRQETWINADIEEAFLTLHDMGLAHSVECWASDEDDGPEKLVGGLYGLEIGRAFCGESMFSRKRDASKVALAWLVARLKFGGFELLDCQFMTEHLASLGAVEVSQQAYVQQLQRALQAPDHSVSAIKSPIRSSGALSGVGAAGSAAGGAGVGDGAGAAGAGAWTGGEAALSSDGSAAFEALDKLLVKLDDADRGAVGLLASSGGSSSPGKLIAQLLTQTS